MRNTSTRVRVLLAEGNGPAGAAIRDVIESIADLDLAWDVHETPEALRLIEQMHPDVALFSHSLMKAQLLATIRATADTSSHTKVLVISMHNDSRLALRAIEAGASGYMLQDRVFEELGDAVKIIMSGRTYLSPGIAGVKRQVRTSAESLGVIQTHQEGKPPAPQEGGERSSRRTNRPNDSRGPARVLVVDDNEFIRETVRTILEGAGYAVVTAATGDEAIAALRNNPPDVAFVDLVLPDSSGVEVIREIRRLDEALPVIIITGYPDSELMFQAMAYSPLVVLAKPFDVKTLLKTAQSALSSRTAPYPKVGCRE